MCVAWWGGVAGVCLPSWVAVVLFDGSCRVSPARVVRAGVVVTRVLSLLLLAVLWVDAVRYCLDVSRTRDCFESDKTPTTPRLVECVLSWVELDGACRREAALGKSDADGVRLADWRGNLLYLWRLVL